MEASKTKQLRIGNHCNNGIVIRVSTDSIDCAGHYNISGMTSFSENDIRFEPLTEEWLVKFGFEKSKMFGLVLEPDTCFYLSDFEFCHKGFKFKPITKVHELQNIYYNWTGQELTLKSKKNGK